MKIMRKIEKLMDNVWFLLIYMFVAFIGAVCIEKLMEPSALQQVLGRVLISTALLVPATLFLIMAIGYYQGSAKKAGIANAIFSLSLFLAVLPLQISIWQNIAL